MPLVNFFEKFCEKHFFPTALPSVLQKQEHWPKNFEEFVNMWDGQIMDPSSKRMIVFAPDAYPWREIAENCESVFMIPSQAGEGLADVHYDTVLSNIVNSI